MKKRNIIRNLNLAKVNILIILIFIGITSCTSQKTNQEVFEAYKLRINGQADSAKVLLTEFTDKNPENALAWFELCRTTEHIGRSNPRKITETLEETLLHINKAIDLNPENAKYLSYKGKIQTLQFYMALQSGNENTSEYLPKIEETYTSVLELDPSYYENKLTLVEFFGGLPAKMGGDIEKAEKYALELEQQDMISGAKAREILMPEDADYEVYWKEIIKKAPENADAHQALGRVYLFLNEFDKANIQYQKAIDIDPNNNILYLDLGKYFVMMAMQKQAPMDSVVSLAEEQFNKFLNFSPEPLNPMKAWTYATLAMLHRRTGNKDLSEKYLKKAKSLDPYFSPSFGKPSRILYSPPEDIVHYQSYYFSPF